MRRRLTVLCLPLALSTAGCFRSGANVDLLEARLRDQQDLVHSYERRLQASESELEIARKDSQRLREQLAAGGKQPILPEHADVLLRAEKLEFHNMMTGFREADPKQKSDVITVVLTPQAGSGETVRLIGNLEIEALDLSQPAGNQAIGRWKFTPKEAADHWHAGFLASGFQFDLPCHRASKSPQVVLHARLAAPDGRRLEATHTLNVGSGHGLAKLDAPKQALEEPRPLPPAPRSSQPLSIGAVVPGLIEPASAEFVTDAAPAPFPALSQPARAIGASLGASASLDAKAVSGSSDDFRNSLDRGMRPLNLPQGRGLRRTVKEPATVTAEHQAMAGAASFTSFESHPAPEQPAIPSPAALKPLSEIDASEAGGAGGPLPFPTALPVHTSDRWTEGEIPVLR